MARARLAGYRRGMDYTKKNLEDVKDSAAEFGRGDAMAVRFAGEDLGCASTGFSLHQLKPDQNQGFAHRHVDAEEVYVVIAGSGRVMLDDETVELARLDALRLAPPITRRFEAGPDGLEFLVFGPHHEKDGEIVPGDAAA